MSRRDDRVALAQMLDHSREACALAENRSRRELDSDRLFNLAMTRLIEIIGEAATRVSEGRQASLDSIPWAQIIGMRNRLIHGYDSVDLDILWSVIDQDLPALVDAVEDANRALRDE